MHGEAGEVGLPEGVERNRMLASLNQRLFGAQESARLGRFELGRRLGAGGMGVVYEAHDPELDRSVALKVLRATSVDPKRVERLVLEARSLAKLRHPNVVAVYEVGQDESDRFIVMDLVQGQTLRAWLETPRSWRSVVRMFIRAGQGLWAAHQAGLVHRDFKPENVLVEGEQPKVADFGLAATVTASTETTLSDEPPPPVVDRLTRTEAFVGTPAYMAPEQFRGELTPAADQYAFCLALYEALCGHRPHADAEAAGIEAIRAARERQPPPGQPEQAPRWLRRVLARGLQPDPRLRWPSLDELLVALRRVEVSWPQRAAAGGGLLGLVAAGAGVGAGWSDAPATPCAAAPEPMNEAWSSQRQDALREAFAETKLAYAEDTWNRVARILDDYASGWKEAAARACVADLAAPRPLPPLNAARQQCLSRRLSDFESLLSTFIAPNEDVIGKAIDAASTIPSMHMCDESELVRGRLEQDVEETPQLSAIYDQVAAADAAFRLGNDELAARKADDVIDGARAAGSAELAALGAMVLANAKHRQGALEESERATDLAVEAAEQFGDDRIRVRAKLRLLALLIERRTFDEAKRHARYTTATLDRLPHAAGLRARLGELEAKMLLYQGEAKQALERLAEVEPVVANDPFLRGSLLDEKANTLEQLGRHDDAVEAQRHGLRLLGERLGEQTPRVISARMLLATSLSNMGRVEEGLIEARRCVADADAVAGADSLLAARARGTLATAYGNGGQLPEAAALFRRAARDIEAILGPEHPRSADGWLNLAHVLTYLHEPREAIEVLEHAEEILLHTVSERHPEFIFIHSNLAEAYLELEQWADALRSAEKARSLADEHLAANADRTFVIRIDHAIAQRGVGELDASQAALEDIIEALEAMDARSALVGRARCELGFTLAAAGDVRGAASALKAARREIAAENEEDLRIEKIDAWLRAH